MYRIRAIETMNFDPRRNGNETKNGIAWNGATAFGKRVIKALEIFTNDDGIGIGIDAFIE